MTPQHALCLQRSIGNRALVRLLDRSAPPGRRALLRQPSPPTVDPTLKPDEDAVRAEVEADRQRFEAARARHEQRLEEIKARERPHVLREAGVTADTPVDGRTSGLVQAALAESLILREYLKGKFPGASIPGAKFKVHDFDEEFEYWYAKLNKVTDNLTAGDVKADMAKARGFFDRASNTIHLRPRSTFGHALHEAIHKVSSPGFLNFFGKFLNEGVTQFFTDEVLREQGLAAMSGHGYGPNLSCAERLVRASSWQLVARAYFVNHVDLMNALMTKLRVTPEGLRKMLKDEQGCKRLP